jgi:hypothetical protein
LCSRLVLRRVEPLVADDERHVFRGGLVETLTGRSIDRLAQVDARDLRADVFLDLGDFHRLSPAQRCVYEAYSLSAPIVI